MAPEPDRSPPEAPDSSPADPAPRKEPATVGVADDALYRVGLRKPYLPDSARQRHRKTVAFTVAGTALVIALLYFRLVGWVTPWTLEETPAVLRALEGPPTKSGGSGGTLPGAPR